ncbi:MAG: 5-formyltetrahydrofolate cyclo-ligase [Thalassolituus oleivorans]|jgi:5-formyltetrahydrofolate cyclo-ligase
MTDKASLRRRISEALAKLTPQERVAQSLEIVARIEKLPELSNAGAVAAFWPTSSEPGIDPLLEALHEKGVWIYLPVVTDFSRSPGSAQRMHFSRFCGRASLRPNRWGIMEPVGGAASIMDAKALFVPSVAVDRTGARLGHGYGYYDHFLAGMPHDIPTISPVFRDQLLPQIPVQPHDQRLSVIITADEMIRTPSEA